MGSLSRPKRQRIGVTPEALAALSWIASRRRSRPRSGAPAQPPPLRRPTPARQKPAEASPQRPRDGASRERAIDFARGDNDPMLAVASRHAQRKSLRGCTPRRAELIEHAGSSQELLPSSTTHSPEKLKAWLFAPTPRPGCMLRQRRYPGPALLRSQQRTLRTRRACPSG